MKLRALAYPNFRLYFAGQFVSLIGTWIQHIAISWLVYRLTGSAFMLGIAAFAQQIPILIFAPFAGVWADHFNRKNTLMWLQTLALLQALILALLTFMDVVEVWHLIVMALLLGGINAFDSPLRHAFLLDMVGDDKEALPNAIALQSLLMNTVRFIGPSIGGILLAAFGEAWCFVVNTFSFLAILVAYYLMKVPAKPAGPKPAHTLLWIKEGIVYAYRFRSCRILLFMVTAISFMAAPHTALMPIFAKEVFHGDSQTLGFLIGAVGLGALIGTFYLAYRDSIQGISKLILYASFLSGIGLMVFSVSNILTLSLLMMVAVGFGTIVTAAASHMALQSLVEDVMRGRVISLFVTAFLGFAPLGNVFFGGVAQVIGAPYTLLICGLGCFLVSLGFSKYMPKL